MINSEFSSFQGRIEGELPQTCLVGHPPDKHLARFIFCIILSLLSSELFVCVYKIDDLVKNIHHQCSGVTLPVGAPPLSDEKCPPP